MTRQPGDSQPASVPTTAEAWLARLQAPDCSSRDEDAFERWRAADPEHAAAYAEVDYLHRHAARLADDPLLRAVARAARRDLAGRRTARPHRTWMLAVGMAACLLLVAGLLFFAGNKGVVQQRYAQAVGLPRSITLEDGTRVQLDAQSRLTTRFGRHRREVTLLQGRAQFDVAHDAGRPFVVHAGDSEIHDVGTIFQVSRGEDGVTVGLLSGRVSVSGERGGQRWASQLQPAQQVHIQPDGVAGAVVPLDAEQAESWPRGELSFHDRRLDDLLTAMNRYSTTRLRLGDPALGSIRVSGNFHAGDQGALIKALARGWQLRAQPTGADELTLLPATGRR